MAYANHSMGTDLHSYMRKFEDSIKMDLEKIVEKKNNEANHKAELASEDHKATVNSYAAAILW